MNGDLIGTTTPKYQRYPLETIGITTSGRMIIVLPMQLNMADYTTGMLPITKLIPEDGTYPPMPNKQHS